MITSHSVVLTMTNLSEKTCRKNQKARSMFNDVFSRAVYETECKNIVQQDTPQIAAWYGKCALRAGWFGYRHIIICNIALPLLLFDDKNGYVNAPQCYFIRTSPTFLAYDFENVLVGFNMVRRSFQFCLLVMGQGKSVQQDCSEKCILKDWMAHYRWK
jgi:hypothetical protein